VGEEERREKQDVIINVILFTDLRKPAAGDKFEDAVDYRAIKKKIVETVGESKYYLVEALAERIAELCLENPDVEQVQVTVDKPAALRFARSVAVEIVRDRRGPQ
jgi:FolB domain-containing protein